MGKKYWICFFVLLTELTLGESLALLKKEADYLENLFQSLLASQDLSGDRATHSQKALEEAELFFDRGDFSLAIPYYQIHHALDQTGGSWESHHHLGMAYENVQRPDKAFWAYKKGIQKKATPILYEKLFRLSEKSIPSDPQILSDLIAPTLPRGDHIRRLFWAARIAREKGWLKLSQKWLSWIEVQDRTQGALYDQGLAFLQGGEIPKARLSLEKSMTLSFSQEACLLLAKIALFQNRLKEAGFFYDQITPGMSLFPVALHDRIYLSLREKNYSTAFDEAKLYLKDRWDPAIDNLRDFLAGLNKEPLDFILNKERRARDLLTWVRSEGNKTPNIQSLFYLKEKSLGFISFHPKISFFLDLQLSLREKKRDLLRARQELKEIYFGLSHLKKEKIRPDWEDRFRQIKESMELFLSLGEKIALLEFQKRPLPLKEKTHWVDLAQKRSLSVPKKAPSESSFLEQQLEAKKTPLFQQYAPLLSLGTLDSVFQDKIAAHKKDLLNLTQRLELLSERVALFKVKNMPREGELAELRGWFLEKIRYFIEASSLYTEDTNPDYLAGEFEELWGRWSQMGERIHMALGVEEEQRASKVQSLLQVFQGHRDKLQSLEKTLHGKERQLAETLQGAWVDLWQYAEAQTQKELAQMAQWKGDYYLRNARDDRSQIEEAFFKNYIDLKKKTIFKGMPWAPGL
jgi:hypothetical protein